MALRRSIDGDFLAMHLLDIHFRSVLTGPLSSSLWFCLIYNHKLPQKQNHDVLIEAGNHDLLVAGDHQSYHCLRLMTARLTLCWLIDGMSAMTDAEWQYRRITSVLDLVA